MKELVYVKKIIESKNIENDRILLEERDMQVTLGENDCMTVGKDGGYIILDFGMEMSGGISIATFHVGDEPGSAKIRVRFGESLTEVSSEIGEKNSTNEHAPRDIETLISFMSTISIGGTGYRYVRIDFYPGEEISIKAIAGTNNILSLPAKYTYQGPDSRIAEIFNVAKRTVDLCSGSGYIWDGVKRDRLVWIGDLYPEILSLTTMYGSLDVIENSLNFERVRPKIDGKWLCSLCTYNLWWVACVAEYYLRMGDKVKDFTLSQMDFVKENIDIFAQLIDRNGNFTCPDDMEFFVDWPTHDTQDLYVGSKLIGVFAMKKAKLLLDKLGMDSSKAQQIIDNLLKGDFTVKEKKQVIALKYFALGEISDEEYEKIIEGGTKGLSTFMSYFILTTVASRDKDLAIDMMKEYYGAMLDKGATTFWEDFDMDWVHGSGRIDEYPKPEEKDIHGDFGKYCYKGFRHSLCHAWSSGVITFIQENC